MNYPVSAITDYQNISPMLK